MASISKTLTQSAQIVNTMANIVSCSTLSFSVSVSLYPSNFVAESNRRETCQPFEYGKHECHEIIIGFGS